MLPAGRTLFLSSYAVSVIFSPGITRCLFKETGRTIPSFLLFYPPRLLPSSFYPSIFAVIPSLFHGESHPPRLPPLSKPPLFLVPPPYARYTLVYRISISRNRVLSVPLATFPRHSFAMRRLRGVNFSYYARPPPLSFQLSSSRMEFLRFRRAFCSTLYSRDEQGGRRKRFHNR